ncbi:MAG TPA: hypothetical protein VFH48_07385, partial [Chloroflexota bacterium]|nr:hypothetical protein [Chloroflexota bacterium]
GDKHDDLPSRNIALTLPLALDNVIDYGSRGRARLMVALRIGDVSLATLDDDAFATVLEAAALAGGEESFPTLFGIIGSAEPIDGLTLMDELAHLAATESGRRVAMLIGTLRDDLMTAVAAAGEG